MDRIYHPTAGASPPSVDSHGTPGYPNNGTVFTPWVGHQIIEELRGLVVAGGLTPDKSSVVQVLAALRAMFAPGIAVFTSSGTFTVPAGVTKVAVQVWGGGGGSGSAASGGASGGGGGGAFGEGVVAVTPGAGVSVTIGAAGTAGSGSNGGNGGVSSFGTAIVSTGGVGSVSAAGGVAGAGGAGGTVSGASATLAQSGAAGANGGFVGGDYVGGGGGPAFMSAGGYTVGAGAMPGAGGGGVTNSSGRAGAAGLVVVRW